MKRVVAVIIVVLALVAYVAGYWPEYQRRMALETEVTALRAERDELAARTRGARLLGLLLNVTEAVAAMNFGQAQTLSSTFFDEVRAEEARTAHTGIRATLEGIQQNRDPVTAALARGDANVIATLRALQIRLRESLGYPVPPAAPVTAPDTPAQPPDPVLPPPEAPASPESLPPPPAAGTF